MNTSDKQFILEQRYNTGEVRFINGRLDNLYKTLNNINFTSLVRINIKVFTPKPVAKKFKYDDEFSAFVSKEILSTDQICAKFKKCIHTILEYETGSPAILFTTFTETKHGFGKLRRTSPTVFADIHLLDPAQDIVINHNLNQIWPVAGGSMPAQLQKILQQSNEGR